MLPHIYRISLHNQPRENIIKMDEIVLQSILDADKNGTLKLFREKESRKIQVFYGVLLLEIVPNDSDHISYRTAAGRLYNAG